MSGHAPPPRTVLYLHASSGGYGADRQLLLMAGSLDPARYRPLVVLPDRGPLVDRLREAGVEVVLSPLAVLRRSLLRGRGLVSTASLLARNVRELGELAERRGAAIVHTNSSLVLCGQRVADRAGAVHVQHVREMYGEASPLWPFLQRRLLRADAVACVSAAVAGRFPPSTRVSVLYDGLARALPAVPRAAAREELGLPADAFVVASIGRISDWKGQGVLLRALAEPALRDLPVVALVAGEAAPGQLRFTHDLVRLAAELGLGDRLRLLGFREDVEVLLAAADAVAVTSIYPDSLPNTAIEAATAGVPLVATTTGGQREIVQHGVTGHVVPPDDPAALALALRGLADDPAAARELARAAARHAEALFGGDRLAAGLQSRYDGLLEAAPRAPAAWVLPVARLPVSHPVAPDLRAARLAAWLERAGYRVETLERRGLAAAPALARRALRERPALIVAQAAVHAPTLAAARLGRRRRPRLIADVPGLHSLEIDQATPSAAARLVLRPVWCVLELLLTRSADVVLTVNDRHATLLRQRYGARNVVTLRDAAESELPDGAPFDRAAVGIPADAVLVAFVGAVVYRRLDVLLDAWASLASGPGPSLALLVVGDGPDLDAYRRRVAADGRLSGTVVLAGGLPRADALAALCAADIAYSDCWSEAGFPAKIFEYMALALPIVAAAKPQLTEVLTDGETALLYRTPAELTGHLHRLAAEPALRASLGAAARACFDAHHTTERREAELVALLGGTVAPASCLPQRGPSPGTAQPRA